MFNPRADRVEAKDEWHMMSCSVEFRILVDWVWKSPTTKNLANQQPNSNRQALPNTSMIAPPRNTATEFPQRSVRV